MWGGLLKSIVDSDLHIILDVVKSSKNSRYNRNKIAGNGEPIWLTIPFVEFKREKLIRNQNLDTSTITKNKLLTCFSDRYKNATYFRNSQKILKTTLDVESNQTNLCEIYMRFLNGLKKIGIPVCNIKFASEILNDGYSINNLKGINLVNHLLKSVEAEIYLGSENTLNYANPSDYFVSKVWIQNFHGESYQIEKSEFVEFIPNLSILDMVSYLDVEKTLKNLDISNKWLKTARLY